MAYYAHKRKDGKTQPLISHLEETGRLASDFAKDFGFEKIAYTIGYLHDMGKYSEDFRKRLFENGPKCDHSSAGAQLSVEKIGDGFGRLCAYPIAGHHAGLMDFGSKESGLLGRLLKKNLPDYSAYSKEFKDLPQIEEEKIIDLLKNKDLLHKDFVFAFLIRMLFSCLTDADFLETEQFMDEEKSSLRARSYNFSEYFLWLEKCVEGKANTKSSINVYRQKIYNQCLKKSQSAQGLFSLTVPTGGGKTLSSMAFALKHAIFHNLKRIVVVIPYTSIIEQNAKEYKAIFGKDAVLEHHSNFSFEPEQKGKGDLEMSEALLKSLKYASENWDIGITVTTTVQFFESLYSNKSGKCRKLHNLSKAVVVLDEAQMMPYNYLKPCLMAIDELVSRYQTTVVLCTATQPKFPENILKNEIVEIMDNKEELYEKFRRTELVNLGNVDEKALFDHFQGKDTFLIIVNKKKTAKDIFEKLGDLRKENKERIFHLTANMCPAHRSEKLEKVREALKEKCPCILVATNLIECGVDVSFPYVYREIAGLDSLIQSAGRCNRNGETKEKGKVYVFDYGDEYLPAYVVNGVAISRRILEKYEDPLSLDAIKAYFQRLYNIDSRKLDKKKIISECFEYAPGTLEYKFQTAAEKFRIIESNTYSLIVPYNKEAMTLTDTFLKTGQKKALKALQPYIVNIYENQINKCADMYCIKQILEGLYVLTDTSMYDDDLGLNPKWSLLNH